MHDPTPPPHEGLVDRPASGAGVFRRLFRLLLPQWPMLLLGLLLLMLSAPCDLFPALVWKYVADDLVLAGHYRPTPILPWLFSLGGRLSGWRQLLPSALAWLMIVYAAGEALGSLSTNVMNRVAQRFIVGFRNRIYDKLQAQSLGYLQRQRLGDLMSRALGDVDELQSFIVNGIDVIVGESLLWVMTVALVMAMDWKVASAALLPLLLVYFLLRAFNARVAPIYKAARDKAGDVATRLHENLAGVVVIKIFGREREESGRFRRETEAYYHQQIRAVNARTLFFPFGQVVGFLSSVAVVGLGGYSILSGGSFTLGKLVAFRAYWGRLFGPVKTLSRVNDMVQRAVAAARRVFAVLDAPDELPDAPNALDVGEIRGEMTLENVTFGYPTASADGTERLVLRDLNLQIEPGRTVALCGPSGSGKSTILMLLLRFYDPTQGRVLLDHRDLRATRRDSLRRHFALVQQETFLFNDSIGDNIRYGHPEATPEQVIAAANAANAHEFIEALPDGYRTAVGERGVRLSGGQKQRISIARAFLANPTILLLDEPTSSVEPESEAAIIAALDRLMAGRTTVLTSHRPGLIFQADQVYVIQHGTVAEQGSPAQLRIGTGWFARFVKVAEFAAVDEVAFDGAKPN